MKTELDKIIGTLLFAYSGSDISEADVLGFASELYGMVFEEKRLLTDIILAVGEFEEDKKKEGIEIKYSQIDYIYDDILHMLKPNRENAKRLYDSFFEYLSTTAFCLMMEDFEEWLTYKEVEEVWKLGTTTFDEAIWKQYV